MASETFVQKTLDKILEVVQVEFKIPLGIADVKFPATATAKNWRANKKIRLDVEDAIRRAEERFIAAHPENKLAQILHGLPRYSDQEYRNVILELLKHLDEEKIIWFAEVKIEHQWNKLITRDEIRRALGLYIPYLRQELNGIKEFREIITARTLERIERHSKESLEDIRRIETKLDRALGESEGSAIRTDEPDYWYTPHPYPMPRNFTGREVELKMLDDWLGNEKDRLFILRALGGFGKSALAWQWITTHVNPAEWTRLVWWSFYERDASFETFIKSLLEYLKLDAPQGTRPQVDKLLQALQKQKILLVMDGFERALRLYAGMSAVYLGEEHEIKVNQLDCKDIHAERFLQGICSLQNIRAKVLLTTQLTPRAVKPHGEFMLGCHEYELTAMQKDDAVEFFRRQGVRGTRTEIEAACVPYGYHPLSLRLLVGRILTDFENPKDVTVAQKISIDGDIRQQQKHVLEVSYHSLPMHEQKLLSTIACFRSPIGLKTLEAIVETQTSLNDDLKDLMDRGLLQFDEKNGKFDLHPIVRTFAYDRLAVSDRAVTHSRLHDYFREIAWPTKPQTLDELAPVIELYYHTVQAGYFDDAWQLFRERIWKETFFRLAAFETQINLLEALFVDGDIGVPKIQQETHQAHALNELANAYALSGRPNQAARSYSSAISIAKRLGEKNNVAIGLTNTAFLMTSVGMLHEANINLQQAITLCQEFRNGIEEGMAHHELGRLFMSLGQWDIAEKELLRAQQIFDELGPDKTNYGSVNWAYRALRVLLMSRDHTQSSLTERNLAIEYAERALALAGETSRTFGPVEYDIVYINWVLGAVHRLEVQYELADQYLNEALKRDRAINAVDLESDILLSLAGLQYDQANYGEAKSLAEEALLITQRCGYVLQGADVNLFLAKYSLEQEQDKTKARQFAETALQLSHCDGPPYHYKVAYHEAEGILKKL